MKVKEIVVNQEYAYRGYRVKVLETGLTYITSRGKGVKVEFLDSCWKANRKIILAQEIEMPWAEWVELKAKRDAESKRWAERIAKVKAVIPLMQSVFDDAEIEAAIEQSDGSIYVRIDKPEEAEDLMELIHYAWAMKHDYKDY